MYGESFQKWEHDFLLLTYAFFPNNLIAEVLQRTCKSLNHWGSKFQVKKIKSVFPGDHFNKLTVLDEFKMVGNHQKLWKCQCKCTNIVWVYQFCLISGHTKSCGCLKKDLFSTGTENIPGWFFGRVKANAKKRAIECNITIQDIEELLIKQDFKCAITKLPLIFRDGNITQSIKKCNASLDRIDSNKPYEKGNIQLIHVTCNIMKGSYRLEYFLFICQQVAKNTEPIVIENFAEEYKKESRYKEGTVFHKKKDK